MKNKSSVVYTVFTMAIFCTALLLFGKLTEDRVSMQPPTEYVYWEDFRETEQAPVNDSEWSEDFAEHDQDVETDNGDVAEETNGAGVVADGNRENGNSTDASPDGTVGKSNETQTGTTQYSTAKPHPDIGKNSSKIYLDSTGAPIDGQIDSSEQTVTSEEDVFADDESFEEEEPKSSRASSHKTASVPKGDPNRMINLNTANVEDLCSLDGIGEVLAKRIIQYRESSGGFSSIEDVMNVSGIGEKKFVAMRARLMV